MTAIRESPITQVQELLAKYPEQITERGPELLEYAAESNRADVLPILVAAGIDVNTISLWGTPLGSAARQGAFEAVHWLLDHGVDINATAERRGVQPLHDAITEGHLDMVKVLIERGADPNTLTGNPARNALSAAKFWGQDEIATFLEAQGLSEMTIEPTEVDVEHPSFKANDISNPVDWFDKKWVHVYDYVLKHGLEILSEKNRILFFVGYLIDQLCNGGTLMVYYNPSGKYTPQMAIALDKIGASRAATVVREINAMFVGGAPATDREEREQQIKLLPRKASTLGAELERLFDEWEPDRGTRLLVTQLYDYYNS